MARLTELIERVERLTGPDREADYRIFTVFAPKEEFSPWYPNDGHFYTASLDAAIALTERVLPPHAIRLSHGHYDRPAAELLVVDDGEMRATIAYGATMALALVLATLKALPAREGANEGG